MNAIKHVVKRAKVIVQDRAKEAVNWIVEVDVVMVVLALALEVALVQLMQFIAVQGAIRYVQQLVKQVVKNLVRMAVKQDVIPLAKIIVLQDVKVVVKQDVLVTVRMAVKEHVKAAAVVHVGSIVMAHVLQHVWGVDIHVWDVVELCSFNYGKRNKWFMAGRNGKDYNFYSDERLPISLQVLLFGWQKLQRAYVLEHCQTSNRLCA